jgi:hypothetical protein
MKRVEFARTPQPYHTGEARAVGTAYHAGLEGFYANTSVSKKMVIGTALHAFDSEVFNAGCEFKWESTREEAEQRIVSMLNAYFDGGHFWPSTYKVLGTEWEFNSPLDNGWVEHGTIDLILLGPDGYTYIVDHKTAGRMWSDSKADARKQNQAPMYTDAVRREFNTDKTVFTFDVMTYAGKFRRFVSAVTPAHIEAVRRKALQVAALFDSGLELPGNPASNLCDARWCDFYDVCEFGAALTV